MRRMANVRVHLLTASEGGRSGALKSGYRSLIRFENSGLDFGFELSLDSIVGAGGLEPGALGTGVISVWAIQDLPALFAGQKFEVREGARVVGSGVILEPHV